MHCSSYLLLKLYHFLAIKLGLFLRNSHEWQYPELRLQEWWMVAYVRGYGCAPVCFLWSVRLLALSLTRHWQCLQKSLVLLRHRLLGFRPQAQRPTTEMVMKVPVLLDLHQKAMKPHTLSAPKYTQQTPFPESRMCWKSVLAKGQYFCPWTPVFRSHKEGGRENSNALLSH